MAEKFYGLLWGSVKETLDPKSMNRIKAYVPAIGDPYLSGWLTPGGWPGSGKHGQGSQYPMQIGASVAIFFEQGDPKGKGIYFGTTSGLATDGVVDFPRRLWHRTVDNQPEGQNRTATLWEDANLAVWVDFDKDEDKADNMPRVARRFVIAGKDSTKGATLIQMNLAAGEKQDTVSIDIRSGNAVHIKADGALKLVGNPVEINGRRVMPYGKRPI